MDLISFFNLGALWNCDEVNELCVKESARCEQEVKIRPWRADLKCGDVYVEVEPAERLACGVGQALLWRAAGGVGVALLLYGNEEAERAKTASLLVPVLYIDVELKIVNIWAVQVVAFLSASGGVGKTTIAAHLAHKFLSEGKKVLLIDLDPSAGLSTALLGEAGVAQLEEKKRTVGDALLKFLRGESVELVDYVTAAKLGIYRVDLVPSGDSLSDAMGLAWFSGSRPSPERLLRQFLERSGASSWDVVILDTLPFYERRYTLTAFYAADKIIVVTHPCGAEPFRVKRMYNKLTEMVTTDIDKKARVLINRVDNRTKEAREAFKIVKKSLNLPRFQTIISQRVAYSKVPAMSYLGDDNARKEIESLYSEVKEWLNIELTLY